MLVDFCLWCVFVRLKSFHKKKKNKLWKKILEEYCIKIEKIDHYFLEHNKEKIQVDKNGCKYILFRIDVYFTEYFLAKEIDEKEEKRREALEKNLTVNLLELIQVKVMMKIMNLVEYEHLFVNLKTED